MSKRQRAEESSVEKEQRQTHSDHAHWVVFVLVKTADKEGDDDDDDENDNEFGECKAESDVIGVYRSHSQAEKSKDKETEGMETSDGFTFHTPNGGKPYYTTFEIHKEIVQDNDDDDDGDDEDDDDELEEEDSDINDEEDDQRDSDDDDEPDSDENDEVDSDDDDNVEDDEEEDGGRKEEPKQSSFNGPSSGSGIMEGQRYDSDVDEFMDSEDEKDSDDDDDVVEVVQLPPDNDDDDDDVDDDVDDDDDDDDGVPVQGQGGDWSGRPGHHCELCNRSSEGVGPRRGFDYKLNVCGGCVELD